MKTKQVIIIRKDLKMRKGKMIAQGAHASMKIFFDMMTSNNGQYSFTLPEGNLGEEMKDWINGTFTKVVVSVNSLEELMTIYNGATKAGLPTSKITDLGLTEFNNVPTITAIAIGPSASEKIDPLTSHLPLL